MKNIILYLMVLVGKGAGGNKRENNENARNIQPDAVIAIFNKYFRFENETVR